MSEKQKILILTGPTATGKTALSIELAKELSGEIISADSMQLYRGMDIGTAKPTQAERAQVPHHLIDTLDPREKYSVALYRRDAGRAIGDIAARGKLPIVVGGTGLYISALAYDMRFTDAQEDTALREKWERFATLHGNEALHKELMLRDPKAAEALHPNNVRRVIRALEVFETTGRPMSSQEDAQKGRAPGEYDCTIIGLCMDRQALYKRIEARVDQMLDAGLLEETRRLLQSGVSPDCQSMQAIGYKELVQYLTESCSYAQAVEMLKRNTRRYAKRQMTWFRAIEQIHWIDVGAEKEKKQIIQKINSYYLGNVPE